MVCKPKKNSILYIADTVCWIEWYILDFRVNPCFKFQKTAATNRILAAVDLLSRKCNLIPSPKHCRYDTQKCTEGDCAHQTLWIFLTKKMITYA